MNKIKYLDGVRLNRALVAGINNVISNQEYLNKINVFPVPDGDTGTNMAFTLSTILEVTKNKISARADDMLLTIADAALDGARGNSGVILAQFFQGMSDGSVGIDKMYPKDFSKAIQFGADYARDALAEPKEGTILTVLTDFSNYLIEQINNKTTDFEQLLSNGIVEAEKSLENTPNLLPILKKAGVVDAGAKGFVDLLNGIYVFITEGDVKDVKLKVQSVKINEEIKDNLDFHNSEFRFCTECIIKGENISHKELRESLLDSGDSLVLAGSKKKAKIHIHVNEPADVFEICSSFGQVSGQKADDMWQQQEDVKKIKSKNIAIVTDSGADLPEECDLDIHVVPVRYSFGEKGYIDKVSQTSVEFYEELSKNPIHPQTSQPTPGDFRRQYQFLNSHYDSIISIHIPHKLSGTYQSALNASKRLDSSKIKIIDGFSASVGLGLIVINIAKQAQDGKKYTEILETIPKIIEKTEIYLAIKDLSYIVKGGRLPSWVKKIADFCNIKPILTTKGDGSMGVGGVLRGNKNLAQKLSTFIIKKLDKDKSYSISIAHSNTLENGQELLKLIKNNHKNISSIYLMDLGCALGVHAGPGSLAVAIQPD